MKVSTYKVTLDFVNHIHGGVPILSEDLTPEERAAKYEPWLTKQNETLPADFRSEDLDTEALALALAVDEAMPTGDDPLNGFKRVNGRPVIETRQVVALFRTGFQRLGWIQKHKMRQVIQHDVVVRALDNGDYLDLGVEDISGVDERPIHVQTPMGPRSSIALNEYVEGASITFLVKVLEDGVAKETLTYDRLVELLDYASEFDGLGANRAQGFGRFTVREVTNG